jgi:hypothetical protein
LHSQEMAYDAFIMASKSASNCGLPVLNVTPDPVTVEEDGPPPSHWIWPDVGGVTTTVGSHSLSQVSELYPRRQIFRVHVSSVTSSQQPDAQS